MKCFTFSDWLNANSRYKEYPEDTIVLLNIVWNAGWKAGWEQLAKRIMNKQLTELTKPELVSIIQDYQEMVSDIEEELNRLNQEAYVKIKFKIRNILDKYL